MKSAKSRVPYAIVIASLLVMSVACVGNSPDTYGFASPDSGVGLTVSRSVDSNGGTLQVPGNAASLTIPSGALAGATAVSVTVKDRTLSPNASSLGSQVYDFGPPGTQFLQPVTMVVQSLDPPPSGQRPVLAYLNAQGVWQVVAGSVYNATAQTVTAPVSHFTDFAVLFIDAAGAGCAASPDPAAFCSPQVCDAGQNLCVPAGTATVFHVGGTLSGLGGGSVTLSDNGSDALTLSANGNFVFATTLADMSGYAVAVTQQPNNQFCSVAQGVGTVAGGDVSQVNVSCVPTFAIAGSVIGLTGSATVVLQNGNDQVSVPATQPNFVIDRVPAGGAYAVTVVTSPAGLQCTPAAATGTVGTVDVDNVSVICSSLAYPVGGQVQGLVNATEVTLHNGPDTLTVANGSFTFPTPVAFGAPYAVTLTSPAGEACTFMGVSSGTMGSAAVTNVSVVCTADTYGLGGRVTGLVGATQVSLAHGADTLAAGNGAYTLPTAVAYGAAYSITVTAPVGQTCLFGNGNTSVSGTMPATNVVNANVACTPTTYSVGGTVSGLVGQANVVLHNGGDTLSVSNGAYTFPTPVAYGGSYAVTLTSPAGETCSVTGAQNGTVNAANVSNVTVACIPKTYGVGGMVSGLVGSTQLTLQNGSDTMAVGNGMYTFATPVAYGSTYSAQVISPAGQVCNFSPLGSNAGTMGSAAVTNINVVCGSQAYTLGGSVTGLMGGTTVRLSDGTDNINVGSGSFTFPSSLAYGSSYNVTLTSPAGQLCVFNGASSGMVQAADVTSLSVSCSTLSYNLGGTVSGLVGNTQVSLSNGADTLSVGNVTYVFPTRIMYGAVYNASLTSPVGQTCAFSPGGSNAGTMPASDVTQVNVACTPMTYTLGGTVSGLVSGTQVMLQDGTDSVTVGGGTFTFPTAVAYGAAFTVAVTSPAGQQCTLGGTQSGPMPANNVGNISVSCSPQSYAVGGTVSGLMYGGTLMLQNGADTLNLGNGSYAFPTQVAYTANYNVILRAPGGQACTFTPGHTSHNGMMPASAIVDINVSCVLLPYSISINAPGSVVSGAPFSVTISVLDLAGNVLTGYTGDIQFSSSDPAGTPGTTAQDVPFVNTDQGVVTLNGLQLTSTGQQMLTANDAVDQVQGEADVNVTLMYQSAARAPRCGVFFTGAEPGEPGLLPAEETGVHAVHAAVWPPFSAPGLRVERGRGVAATPSFVALAGLGMGESPSYALVDAFDLAAHGIVLDAASYVSYWVYIDSPQDALSAARGLLSLELDGGRVIAPGDPFAAPAGTNRWHHVHLPLGDHAGQRARRVALGWRNDGARGPTSVRFDAIHVVGTCAP